VIEQSKVGHIIPETHPQPDTNVELKEACSRFVKSEMPTYEFKTTLQKFGINPKTEAIESAISKAELGESKDAFKNLFSSILKNKTR